MRISKVCSLAATAALIAGCSGNGGSPVAPVAHSPSTTVGSASKATTKLVLTLPNRKGAKRYALGGRKPKYVSPSTAGLIATVTGGALAANTTSYQGYNLAEGIAASTDSPATCTGTPGDGASYTCTLYFDLVPSADQYSVTLTAYDAAESGTTGTPGSSDNALSTDTESFTVAANTANTESFVLQGIVRGFFATRQYHGIPNTAKSTQSVTFLPLDADGNPITGTEGLAYYNGSTFVENASFAPSVTDEHCLATPCYTLDGSAAAVTSGATDTFTVDYNGESDPGVPQPGPTAPSAAPAAAPPGFGMVNLSAPQGYVGYSSYGSAATEYLEPFFPAVDQNSPYQSGAASVSFTQPGQPIAGYGIQANMNSGSAGYFVDDSDCSKNATYADIADVSNQGPNTIAGYSVVFGTTFSITAGSPTLLSGDTTTPTCTIRVYDDSPTAPSSGSVDEADIAVTYTPNGSNLTINPGTPGTPNARKRDAR